MDVVINKLYKGVLYATLSFKVDSADALLRLLTEQGAEVSIDECRQDFDGHLQATYDIETVFDEIEQPPPSRLH